MVRSDRASAALCVGLVHKAPRWRWTTTAAVLALSALAAKAGVWVLTARANWGIREANITANLDIANRALQLVGTRINMSSTEFNAQTSNEAVNMQLIMFQLRDELNRMAPWDCATKWTSLTYITTIPGNPENTVAGAGAPLWQPGQPPPPWSYEYQYPVDCLRARKIIPQYTLQAGGTPIYPATTVTGSGQIGWTGPALKFKVATDQFFVATAATVVAGGTGYAVGDFIILAQPTLTFQQNSAPVGQPANITTFTADAGAPAVLQVLTAPGGVIATVQVVNQVQGEATNEGGSYFAIPTNPVAQGSSVSASNPGTSSGTGATFNLSFTPAGGGTPVQVQQRVILCNQTQAILCYNAQVTDPNVMDPLFQDAWVHVVGARLAYQLSGDKGLANTLIGLTNNMIMEARKVDGNEGITVNDVTPDFLRTRGGYGVGPNFEYSPNIDFDWGTYYSPY